MRFYYIYKALAHPEHNGYVRPFTLKERLAHVKEAQRTLGSGFTWICDGLDNSLKHAMGNAPNSEFVIDGDGRVVRKRSWSDAKALRKDLVELVGPVGKPTDPATLKLKTAPPHRAAASGVVKRIEVPGNLRALVIEPRHVESGPRQEATPFYAKLRAEADADLLAGRSGTMFVRFMMDPLYHVHWNNLVEPIRVRFRGAAVATGGEKQSRESEVAGRLDSRVQPAEWTGPTVKEPADIDPREFLVEVSPGESREPLVLEVHYFACHDQEGWCRPVTQVYTIHLRADRDGGWATRRRPGGGRNGRRGGDLAGRPDFRPRPGFLPRPGIGRRPFPPGEPRRGPATALFGRVVKIDAGGGRLLVESRAGDKRKALVTERTRIERNRKPARLTEIRPGDRIVIRHKATESGPLRATTILARGK